MFPIRLTSARLATSRGRLGAFPWRLANRWSMGPNKRMLSSSNVAAFKYSMRRFENSNKDNHENKNSGSGSKGQPPSRNLDHFLTSLIATSVIMSVYSVMSNNNSAPALTFQDFKTQYLEKGLVKKIWVVNRSYVEAELHAGNGIGFGNKMVGFTIGSLEVFEEQVDDVQDKLGIPAAERLPISYVERGGYLGYLVAFLPAALIVGGSYYMMSQVRKSGKGSAGMGGLFNVGKSKAKIFNQETDIKVNFKDVAGCDEAKEEIMEFVKFLKDPKKYERLGAKIPRGAILSGPPGTGKTLLAKATAGEAGVPFLSVSGSEFVEMFVGVGASRVRDLFETARKLAPAIVFVDEIDAIGRERSSNGFGNDEKEATLNQLLVEMDGFQSSDHVVVLAGTNRADVLDKALMRPGRFDRHISIDRPDISGRMDIFKVHLSKLTLADPLNDRLTGRLSAMTPGFSGADIANCCNEAALIAARLEANSVELKHFEMAIERVIAGLERKSRVLSPEEKKTVAFHEAGHAICGWYLEHADPLMKVSIIPRGQGALGYAQYLPADAYLISQNQFMDRMIMALGGRVSEELHFPSVTTGASDDFSKVTRMAQAMITKLGMSKELGTITFEQENKSGGVRVAKPFSEDTAYKIDQEVKKLVDSAHDQCKKMLTEKLAQVDLVANELLTKEVITRDDMLRLLGPRPFPEKNEAFKKYMDQPWEKSAPPPPPEETAPLP
ncbi:unnamed protein product [Kuraishia capsulata CBS 1993]|uniref:AAA+ ATPase domain-containing protein n=1 Tax=Kuraishia capsulata CBS 1993 TaxID=1382522 RepID=W6MGD6_9ASCO|nr:uncharacterized protein KUCA_T00001101001 [Kuraishia capsulata CBS 1993]CDK25134.1 unnamed protein product [Kuraishia capsulata CBS 1993]